MATADTLCQSYALTESEKQQFWEDGYLIFEDVFSLSEVEAFRQAITCEAILGNVSAEALATTTVHQINLTAREPRFLDLAKDPRIVDRIQGIIGDDIQLQHSKIAVKGPTKGVGGFQWHQDYAYFPHSNTDLVAVMVALDHATPDNGCMQVLKGSHRLGPVDHERDGVFSGGAVDPAPWQNNPQDIVDIVLPIGSVSIHHCLSLHGSDINRSGESRRTIVFQYRADDAYQLGGTVSEDCGAMIAGTRSGRVRCTDVSCVLPRRPKGDAHYPFGYAWRQAGSAVKL